MNVSYTKKGDDGLSSLGDGSRQPKGDIIFKAVGTIDELSSVIGVLKAEIAKNDGQLDIIQINLVQASAIISYYYDKKKAEEFEEKTKTLEGWIDEMESNLPPLHKFILPGGCKTAAQMHICRTVARRAERRVQETSRTDIRPILIYLNRLSSYFFTRARFENKKEGVVEQEYTRL
jgi:cob(I)alamin adenosyltransferase